MSAQDWTDVHHFSLTRYPDDSIDISCSREGFDVDHELAHREASVLARNLFESINDTEEVFSLHACESGMVSTTYRDESHFCDSRARFMWAKESIHQGMYSAVLGYPAPPPAVMRALWSLEWAWAAVARRLTWRKTPVETDDSEEVPEEPEAEQPVTLADNVVRFPGRT